MNDTSLYTPRCPIEKCPDLKDHWERMAEEDPDAEEFPGYKEALEAHLENSNYHEWTALPGALETIIDYSPMGLEDKHRLFRRICNAIYNLDIIEHFYQ